MTVTDLYMRMHMNRPHMLLISLTSLIFPHLFANPSYLIWHFVSGLVLQKARTYFQNSTFENNPNNKSKGILMLP